MLRPTDRILVEGKSAKIKCVARSLFSTVSYISFFYFSPLYVSKKGRSAEINCVKLSHNVNMAGVSQIQDILGTGWEMRQDYHCQKVSLDFQQRWLVMTFYAKLWCGESRLVRLRIVWWIKKGTEKQFPMVSYNFFCGVHLTNKYCGVVATNTFVLSEQILVAE